MVVREDARKGLVVRRLEGAVLSGHHAIECIARQIHGSVADYLIPMTMESGPTRCSTRVEWKPASFIQAMQSAPV